MLSKAKITLGDLSEDALPTESALLGPDSPRDAGGRGQDKQGEALVIPEKAEVGKKMINKPGVAVKIEISTTKQKKAYEPIECKKKAPPGTAARSIASMAAKEVAKKELLCAAISSNVPEVLSLPSFGDTSS